MVSGMDFVTTRNDSHPETPLTLSSMFAELNEPFIKRAVSMRTCKPQNTGDGAIEPASAQGSEHTGTKTPVITFSHFLPRQECCPEKRFISEQHLMKVIGTEILDSQIRRLQSDVHLVSFTFCILFCFASLRNTLFVII